MNIVVIDINMLNMKKNRTSYQKEYREKNKDKLSKYNKERYKKNTELLIKTS